MKKFLILIFILPFTLVGCNNIQNSSTNSFNYNSAKTTTFSENKTQSNIVTNVTKIKEEIVETEIASFSTTIHDPNDTARVTNISLACNKLNGTIVKSRRSIFFL